MHLFIVTLLLMALLTVGCDTPITPPPQPVDSLTVDLVAYYPFNGTALDSSGNGHHGIAADVIPVSDRFGTPAGAFAFSGDSTSFITVGNAGELNFAGILDFSICVWIKLHDVTKARGGIISKASENPGLTGYQLQMESATRLGLLVGTNRGLVPVHVSSDIVSDTAWHLITVVVSRKFSNASLFIDGSLIGYRDNESINGSVDTKAPMTIGKDYASNAFFTGSIDDIRIYNRALRRSEIDQLYHLGEF